MTTERNPLLDPFDVLVGTWDTEATHPLLDAVAPGTATFEWLEAGTYLIMRWRNEHEMFPDVLGVVGAPETGDGLVMEHFDSRGVRRTYHVSLEDGVLRFWRDDDPAFAQRSSATLGADGFEAQWEVAETPGEWKDDVHVVYRRRSG